MSGTLVLITPPDEDIVTLGDAKAYLRITADDKDDMIEAMIAACVQQIDPAGGGWLGRALRPQTWELRLDAFPYGHCGSGYSRDFRLRSGIELPYPPLIEVVSFKYDNASGVEQTLALGTDYRVLGQGAQGKTVLQPAYSKSWPSSVRCDHEAVRIRFTSGYEAPDSPGTDPFPAPIRQSVLLMLRQMWGLGERNLFVSAETVDGVGSRNFVVSETASLVMRSAAENLLSTYRIWE